MVCDGFHLTLNASHVPWLSGCLNGLDTQGKERVFSGFATSA
jgi:hypothetical protein